MKVLIVDDHPIVLSGCRALLAETNDMRMLEARDAASAQEVYAAQRPDVAVIDINLPDISGFELARRLLVRDPKARILMFSMNDDPMFAAQAIEGGAKGYFSKSDDPQDFISAIRDVYAGGHSLPLDMAQKIAFLRNAGESVVLSSREREVLRLLAHQRLLQNRRNDVLGAARQVQRAHADAAHPHCRRAEDRQRPARLSLRRVRGRQRLRGHASHLGTSHRAPRRRIVLC
jgi:two-component system invasion response regulator UvrY